MTQPLAPVLIVCVAFSVSIVLVAIASRLALRFRLYDLPGELKIHRRPIPRIGGIGIVGGVLAASVLWVRLPLPESAVFHGCLLLLFVVGLLDDLRQLSPLARLAAQSVAAALLAWGYPSGLGLPLPPVWNGIVTCLFVIACVNAFNFLDGSDGLAAGVSAVIALGYALLLPPTAPGVVVALALAAGCAGFLTANFPPAKVFMGDGGSTSLGFLAAWLGLSMNAHQTPSAMGFVLPLLLAGLPLADFGLAVLRRLSRRRSIFAGDRDHYYDRLLRLGWSARRVALSSYAASALLITIALVLRNSKSI